MNNQPNPLIPEGSFLEQKNKGRARVKIAVFFVLAVHGIGLMALLMQGCRREESQLPAETPEATNNTVAVPDFQSTNVVASTNDIGAPVAPGGTEVTNNVVAPSTNNVVVPPSEHPVGASSEYTIVKGDTFSGIAKKFNVTVKALQEANPNVAPTKLQIGQKIVIPAPSAAAPVAPTGAATTPDSAGTTIYEVKSGDSLSKIATEFHVTVRAIRTANNLKTDSIKVGQKLKIPAKAPGAAPVSTPPPAGQ